MQARAHESRVGRHGSDRAGLRLVRPEEMAAPDSGHDGVGPFTLASGPSGQGSAGDRHVADREAPTPARLDAGHIDAFANHMRDRGRSRRTVECYASDLRLLVEWAGPVPLSELDETAGVWLTRHRKRWSAATVRRRLVAVRSFAKHHGLEVLADYKAPTPARGVAHPVQAGRDGIMAMIDIAETPQQEFVLAACGIMGLRVSEAVSVHAADIDTARWRMRVTGKGSKDRWVPVPEVARPIVTTALDGLAGHVRVANVTTRTVARWVAALGAEAGLGHVKTHDLRHTAGTHAYRKSGSVRTVQTLLGHADPRTTAIYTAVDWDEMAEAVE